MKEDLLFRFEVVNIKLQTNKKDEEKTKAYIKLLTDLVDLKIHAAVGNNKHIILYSYFRSKTSTGIEYIYGKIGKGLYFENEQGNIIDIQNSKTETIDNDMSKIFEAITTDYIFIPEAHRFCINIRGNIYGSQVKKFLMHALQKVVDPSDIFVVEVENEPKIIDEILQAKFIHKINYVITYTNDDVLETTGMLFDKRLKKSNIGKIEVKAESDHNNFLNTKGEELLEGGIELARSNGGIKSATITTNSNIRKDIKSNDTPRIFEFKETAERFKDYIAELIIQTFRPKSKNGN